MLIQGLDTLSLFLQKSWQGLAKASHAFSLAKTTVCGRGIRHLCERSEAIHVVVVHGLPACAGRPRHSAFAPFLEDDDPLSTSLSLRALAKQYRIN